MPIIDKSSYSAPFWCTNPHIQTVFPVLFRKVKANPYRRERIKTPDNDFLDLDWAEVGSKRLAIVLHGLEGDTGRPYMRGMSRALNRSNWDVLALNFRGCSGEPNLQPRMYHSGETEDLNLIVNHAIEKRIYDRIVLLGFSLGGNVILKYIGEKSHGLFSEIKAAVAISVPCDLAACSLKLESTINRPYLYRFLRMLKSKIDAKALVLPGSLDSSHFHCIKLLKDFDDHYTAPLHGFADADDYYRQSSSLQFIPDIGIPTLLINAADDPFLDLACYPHAQAQQSKTFYLEIPKHGGHVGFMISDPAGDYWSETRAVAFVNEMAGKQS